MTPISEQWLRERGFKWDTPSRDYPDAKHWTLWLGWAIEDRTMTVQDLGVELAEWREGEWFCWLRADYDSRYMRFIHVRHVHHAEDVELLITGLIGRPFDWADVMWGTLHTPARAAELREEQKRLDMRMMVRHPWRTDEQDETRRTRGR